MKRTTYTEVLEILAKQGDITARDIRQVCDTGSPYTYLKRLQDEKIAYKSEEVIVSSKGKKYHKYLQIQEPQVELKF